MKLLCSLFCRHKEYETLDFGEGDSSFSLVRCRKCGTILEALSKGSAVKVSVDGNILRRIKNAYRLAILEVREERRQKERQELIDKQNG